jgi:carboxymethylenebutenolidase
MDIEIKNDSYAIPAYLIEPEAGSKKGIILIHEVWGLNANMRSLSDRLSAEGYMVLAPDLIAHTGITEKVDQSILARLPDPATKDEAQKELRAALAPISTPEFGRETTERLMLCYDYLKNEMKCKQVAVMGFCFGGTYSFHLAAHAPLAGALPFYGHAPKADELKNISCPVLAFYGEKDTNLVSDLPRLANDMEELGKDFSYKVYPDTGHAFMNDTNPTTYVKSSADDAWQMSLKFLKKVFQ